MSAGKRIIEGAKEALAIARGEQPAASIWHNGFEYVPVPAPANDGCGTVIVDERWFGAEIARLHAELAAARTELAEAKIAIGWARDAGLGEAAKIAEEPRFGVSTGIMRVIAEDIRSLIPSEKGLAAASPFQTEEAKER